MTKFPRSTRQLVFSIPSTSALQGGDGDVGERQGTVAEKDAVAEWIKHIGLIRPVHKGVLRGAQVFGVADEERVGPAAFVCFC